VISCCELFWKRRTWLREACHKLSQPQEAIFNIRQLMELLLTILFSHRNWKTFDERSFDFCQGITLHHLPGHTDGLIGMQINLPDSGTIFFISDHCHVIENVSLS
jgi:glyoxylase-like metal-dependent hydrolase (beta-lactamase superfamily II)